jgi:hypothetical protein
MVQNINQFGQTTEQGQLDLQFLGSVYTARVSADQATALVAGEAVKLDTTKTGGVPAVLALANNNENIYGFVVRNLKDQSDAANANFELASNGSVMYMTAGAAITRGAPLEYVFATKKVITWAGINPIIGYAFDNAAADASLLRVMISVPAFQKAAEVKTVNVTATLAQINAGLSVITGALGKQITVLDLTQRVAGNFAASTSVNLQSSSTAVIVEATAVAGLTAGAVLTAAPTANVTLGAGFATKLPAAEGLNVVNIGAASTGGTSIQFTITYTQA